jgi:hypothetical protein
LKVAQWVDKKINTLLDDMMKLENECLPDIRRTEWWTQFWQSLQNASSQQTLSSAENELVDYYMILNMTAKPGSKVSLLVTWRDRNGRM